MTDTTPSTRTDAELWAALADPTILGKVNALTRQNRDITLGEHRAATPAELERVGEQVLHHPQQQLRVRLGGGQALVQLELHGVLRRVGDVERILARVALRSARPRRRSPVAGRCARSGGGALPQPNSNESNVVGRVACIVSRPRAAARRVLRCESGQRAGERLGHQVATRQE